MQKHPLLSVKEAAEALRLDESSVRDRLANGTLKGEKKMMGLREKWFVYKGSVDSALGKQDNIFEATMPESPLAETPAAKQESAAALTAQATIERPDSPPAQPSLTTTESQAEALESSYIADAVVTEVPEGRVNPSDASRGEWYAEDMKNLESIVNTIMKPLVDKVTAQEREIAAKLSLLHEQEETIKDQKRQLLLLPDMEKERKALELKEHEMTALQKQLTVVAEEKAKALDAKEAEVVSLLKRAEEERVAADQVKKLAESRATEIQGLTHHIATVEEEKQALEVKAAEAAKLAADLQELKLTVEKLQTPWWKKVLGG